MIYKGLQARLIVDPAQGCLPESISLCDPKTKSGKRQSAAQSDVDSWDQGFCADSIIETQESHPSIDVDLSGYSEGVRGKATRAVRRGAVQMAATGDETDLTLAFRWIGAEFTSARRASSLDDLSIAPLRTLFAAHGLGSQHHGDLTTDNDAHSAKWSAPKAALFRVKRRSSRSRLRSKTWAALTCLLAPDRLVDDHTRKHAIDPQGRDFPLIAQLYVDQAPLCLSGSKKSSASSCNTQSFGLRQGAFVRLPPLCLDKVHTVSLHIWKGTRPGLRRHEPFCKCEGLDLPLRRHKSLDQLTADPKATHVPDAIFHFEIVPLLKKADLHRSPSTISGQQRMLYNVSEEKSDIIDAIDIETAGNHEQPRVPSQASKSLSDSLQTLSSTSFKVTGSPAVVDPSMARRGDKEHGRSILNDKVQNMKRWSRLGSLTRAFAARHSQSEPAESLNDSTTGGADEAHAGSRSPSEAWRARRRIVMSMNDIEERLRTLCGGDESVRTDTEYRPVELMDILGAAGKDPNDSESVKDLEMLFNEVQEKRVSFVEVHEQRREAAQCWRSIVRRELTDIRGDVERRLETEKHDLRLVSARIDLRNPSQQPGLSAAIPLQRRPASMIILRQPHVSKASKSV